MNRNELIMWITARGCVRVDDVVKVTLDNEFNVIGFDIEGA